MRKEAEIELGTPWFAPLFYWHGLLPQPLEQERIDVTAKADTAVDFHDRDFVVKFMSQFRVLINIHKSDFKTCFFECLNRDLTQMAALAGVENRLPWLRLSEAMLYPGEHFEVRKKEPASRSEWSGIGWVAEKTGIFFGCMIL